MSSSRPRRPPLAQTLVVVVVAVATTLAGCGVGSEDQAHRLPDAQVPFGLLQPADTTLPRNGPDTVPVALYFVRGERLEPVLREVPEGATAQEVLVALVEGPTPAEARAGLDATLTDPQAIVDVTVSRGVATVDLAPSSGLRSDDQPMAVAQIVFTLTAQPGIGRVSFTIEGEPIEVPDGSGALTRSAVAREDFADLAPAPA